MNTCDALHKWLWSLPRLHFPFDSKALPKNGLYVLFEQGEQGHGGDRIVRIGTHTGDNQLPSRMEQHFLRQNKDRSIFRKHIGRALLAQTNDPYLELWEKDLTPRTAREQWESSIDKEYQQQVEDKVSTHIQDNMSFVVLPIPKKQDRLYWEKKLIATVAQCPYCRASSLWLGNASPKVEIRWGGLWLVQHLKADPLTDEELALLQQVS